MYFKLKFRPETTEEYAARRYQETHPILTGMKELGGLVIWIVVLLGAVILGVGLPAIGLTYLQHFLDCG